MIISRTPFRISFAGGGSDLPAFYHEEPGMVLSTSIDKHMFISMHPYFHSDKTLLKYSKTELVDRIPDIQHPIIRESLKLNDIQGVDISSTADIPAGTGLGSSSTFTVGLLHVLSAYSGKHASKEYLSSQSCNIEINILGEPIGKQDQYAAAYGGLNFITFYPNEDVTIERIVLKPERFDSLQNNLMMFYTGDIRSASKILQEQSNNTSKSRDKRNNLRKMIGLAKDLRNELESSNIDAMGEILHTSWKYKKEMASGMSNEKIDEYYNLAISAGATGGKLLGAGGGGFLLFYIPQKNHNAVRNALSDLRELRFKFDQAGSVIVYNN